jgi:60 kDa SS-A/Ro ribonucleoprotein
MKYADILRALVPQTEALDARQVKNNAGGFVFAIDDWARLDRFLVLGSDAPTYYQAARALTRENAACVERCLAADAPRTIARAIEISDAGRAPKNDPAIFVLALGAAHAEQKVRQLALAALPQVCRTATHLFQFVKAARGLGRGWGRSMKTAIGNWYNAKPVGEVAYQAVKYREREGYSHKRLLQTAHPAADAQERVALYRWMRGLEPAGDLPEIVRAHLRVMSADSGKAETLALIKAHRLPWEALPTEANADPDVWAAMLPSLGLTALVRNLGNMTRIGAIAPLSDAEALVVARLSDAAAIRKSRLHPFAILQAMRVYAAGRSVRGSNSWTPSRPLLDALDGAFYKAFANVVPTGKRHLIGLDVSGSMGTSLIGSVLSARDASAALALVTMAVEQRVHVVGFTSKGHASQRFGGMWGGGHAELTRLAISPRQRLTDAIKVVSDLPFGGTDCALPMLYALEKGLKVDVFTVITDNETWAGSVHPVEALRRYRDKTGIAAKLIVVGMTSTGFSIADPSDAGMLDVVGFDAAAPAVMADFAR